MERRIIVAIDLKEDSEKALHWFMDNVLKEGDEVHVVHVAKLKDETPELFTGTIGSLGSYHYHETNMAQTKAELDHVKEFIRDKIISPLEEAGVSHETHLFVEGENAPATDVAAVIQKVYKEVGADLLIASRSNKTWKERWSLGSVAESLSRLPFPLILVTTAPISAAKQEEAE